MALIRKITKNSLSIVNDMQLKITDTFKTI